MASTELKIEQVTVDADENNPNTADDKKEKRTSRACLTCRKRKSACNL